VDITTSNTRHVILHSHIFKNAGTSLDHILQYNFKEGWLDFYAQSTSWDSVKIELIEKVKSTSELAAVSCHEIYLPLPKSENIVLHPICMIRHPIDRLYSTYNFTRNAHEGTFSLNDENVRLSKTLNFKKYLENLIKKNSVLVKNYQTARFSEGIAKSNNSDKYVVTFEDYECARNFISSKVFCGVVERFEESLILFAESVRNYFPDFLVIPAYENMSSMHSINFDARLEKVKEEIGDLWGKLTDLNAYDFQLYEVANRNIDSLIVNNSTLGFKYVSSYSQELSLRHSEAQDLYQQHREVSLWAKSQDKEVTRLGGLLVEEQNRTAISTSWAQALQGELDEVTARYGQLQVEHDERTTWALALDKSLSDQEGRNALLEAQISDSERRAQDLEGQLRKSELSFCTLFDEKSKQNQELTEHLQLVLGSRSWVLTRPLRFVGRIFHGDWQAVADSLRGSHLSRSRWLGPLRKPVKSWLLKRQSGQ
jgi:Sulfotransferase family